MVAYHQMKTQLPMKVQLPIDPIEKTRTFLKVDLAFSSKTLGSGGVPFARDPAMSIIAWGLRSERESRGQGWILDIWEITKILPTAPDNDSLEVHICTTWNRGQNALLSLYTRFSEGRFGLLRVRVSIFDVFS